MKVRKTLLFSTLLCLLLSAASTPQVWGADAITPAQEQEFSDAKGALEAALKAQAEQFAPEPTRQARNLLQGANQARQSRDAIKFTQSYRLARAYADLAKAVAELHDETEKLVTSRKELEKAKAEIARLKINN